MSDLIRDAPFGQLVRWLTNDKYLTYPEEKPGFQLPAAYFTALNAKKPFDHGRPSEESSLSAHSSQKTKAGSESALPMKTSTELEKQGASDSQSSFGHTSTVASLQLHRTKSRSETVPFTEERLEIDEVHGIERPTSRPIVPVKTSDGTILVDWYTTDDAANPQNWSNGKRGVIAALTCVYTFVVYTGRSTSLKIAD